MELVTGPNGKVIPLDTRAQLYRVVVKNGVDVAVPVPKDERIFVTHFATCPHASAFSGRNK
jgi:hypothetical protein